MQRKPYGAVSSATLSDGFGEPTGRTGTLRNFGPTTPEIKWRIEREIFPCDVFGLLDCERRSLAFIELFIRL